MPPSLHATASSNSHRARPHISNTYAMDWSFDALSCYYRSGFDLSLPLVPGKVFPDTAPSPAPDRDYFLTFKVQQ